MAKVGKVNRAKGRIKGRNLVAPFFFWLQREREGEGVGDG
jgi:hypothetical protein